MLDIRTGVRRRANGARQLIELMVTRYQVNELVDRAVFSIRNLKSQIERLDAWYIKEGNIFL
jgi:hypothetical protein